MNKQKKDPIGAKQVDAVLEEAGKVYRVLRANMKFTFGRDEIGHEEFAQTMQDLRDLHRDFVDEDATWTAAKNAREAKVNELLSHITLARSGIRSRFGADSTEYQLSGCTRTSDRQKPRRKNGNGNGNS
jgi:hypothetical protein